MELAPIAESKSEAEQLAIKHEMVGLIPRLRRFALGLTRNSSEADDMVQMALERALTRLDQYQSNTRLDSWLFRIVQTVWLDARRRQARQGEHIGAEALDNLGEPGSGGAENAVLRQDLSEALASLNEDSRVLVLLVLVEGYSYLEASAQLDIPIGTVMSRLARARKQLMEHLVAHNIASERGLA